MAKICGNCGMKMKTFDDGFDIGTDEEFYLCESCALNIKDDYLRVYIADTPEDAKANMSKALKKAECVLNETAIENLKKRMNAVAYRKFGSDFYYVPDEQPEEKTAPPEANASQPKAPPPRKPQMPKPNTAQYINHIKKSRDSSLFSNPGEKIKRIATVAFWLEVAAEIISLLIGLFVMLIEDFETFIVMFLCSPFALAAAVFVAWLTSLFIYGFGELIEKTSDTADELEKLNSKDNNK